MTSPQASSKYGRERIRRARKCPLKPVLERCGCSLRRLPEGNFEVLGLDASVVVKEHYWTCPDTASPGRKSASTIAQPRNPTTPMGTECDHSAGIPPFLYSRNLATELAVNLVGNPFFRALSRPTRREPRFEGHA